MTLTKTCIVIVLRATIYILNKASLPNYYCWIKKKIKYCADTDWKKKNVLKVLLFYKAHT